MAGPISPLREPSPFITIRPVVTKNSSGQNLGRKKKKQKTKKDNNKKKKRSKKNKSLHFVWET